MIVFILFACTDKLTSLSDPEIAIEPASPTALDALSVRIVEDAVGNEGDTISYTYQWSLDDEPQPDLAGTDVGSDYTLGGQRWTVTVQAFSEELESSVVTSSIEILTTPPSLSLTLPDTVQSIADIDVLVEVFDIDEDETTVQIDWLRDGVSSGQTASTISNTETLRGEVWTAQVTANDGESDSEVVEASVTIVNTPPTIINSYVPETASEREPIVVTADVSDNDEDDIMLRFSWSVAGSEVLSGSQAAILPECSIDASSCCLDSDAYLGDCMNVLSTEYYSKEDEVVLTVDAFDGEEASESLSFTWNVQNTAPSIEGLRIEPEVLYASTTATCVYDSFIDLDLDGDSTTIQWLHNGVEVASGATLDISSIGLVYEDVIECQVTPYDGIEYGTSQTVSTTLSNTSPVVTGVEISPSSVTEDDTITCSALGFEDVDGHTSITYQYGWVVAGVDLGFTSNTLTGADFDKNESVSCYAAADDSYNQGDIVSSSDIVIENDIPLIAGINVTPTAVTSASVLTCGYVGYSDSDPADSDQTIIEWYSGGVKVGDGAIFDIEASSLTRGDQIKCSVTPYDGFEAGYPFTKTLVIYNALPQVSNLMLSPDPVFTNDTLRISADVYDPEGDEFTIEYAWFVNGVELFGVADDELAGAAPYNLFDKGDVVYAEIRATDPYGTETQASASVVVSNTPPPAPVISLTPVNTYEDDDLLCSVISQAADDDGDPLTYTILWEQNGLSYPSPQTTTLSDDTVPSADTVFLDEWTCSVYVYD
ncbi:MAG: hypothetical protein VX278_10500, partial [Myxococcota bacterium]|nr:hypothetical protein [Myxococcota bacterium]